MQSSALKRLNWPATAYGKGKGHFRIFSKANQEDREKSLAICNIAMLLSPSPPINKNIFKTGHLWNSEKACLVQPQNGCHEIATAKGRINDKMAASLILFSVTQ